MGQPVKLSDALVLEARLSGKLNERSIAGQIEYWAGLGRAIEPVLRPNEVQAIKRMSLAECLRDVETPAGKKRVRETLERRPFPHFEQAPGKPGFLVRIEENRNRSVGRFVNRQFVTE